MGDNTRSFILNAIPAVNTTAGTVLAQSFMTTAFNFSAGSFVIADAASQANADFALTSFSQTVQPTDVPEPASRAPLLAGLGGTAAVCSLGRQQRSGGIPGVRPS